MVNLALDPAVTGRKGSLPIDKCDVNSASPGAGEEGRCDPQTWEDVMVAAMEMRERGEKMDRHTLQEDATAAVPQRAGMTDAQKAQARREERAAQAERLERYEAAKAADESLTAEDKEKEKARKKAEMKERIAEKRRRKKKAEATEATEATEIGEDAAGKEKKKEL